MKIKLNNPGTVNKNKVSLLGTDLGDRQDTLIIYFSYETPVSFHGTIANVHYDMTRQNDWSTTTGKLLNECEPDKKKRVDGKVFEDTLAQVLSDFR